MISATILADSIADGAPRLTTMMVTVNRFILPELNTHRVFSRNWRSSRAVPTWKLIEEVRMNPAMPVAWRQARRGMSGGEVLSAEVSAFTADNWIEAARKAAHFAERMMALGLAKETCNRVLEPFLWAHGIISSTEWDNFFKLRLADDAQPEIRALAQAMKAAMDASEPRVLQAGEWHCPFSKYCDGAETWELRRSAAACARVSYTGHDGKLTTLGADLALADRLQASGHWSSFEHQATPGNGTRNFRRWVQQREALGG